jgi:RNA polymerase sigma-70 factor (ECF subfamily)
VQETWLRLSRSDTRDVENLGGWLTTVLARLCLDLLRSRAVRREEPLGSGAETATRIAGERTDPHEIVSLADEVGLALLVVLDRLTRRSGSRSYCMTCFAVPSPRSVGRRTLTGGNRKLASRAR